MVKFWFQLVNWGLRYGTAPIYLFKTCFSCYSCCIFRGSDFTSREGFYHRKATLIFFGPNGLFLETASIEVMWPPILYSLQVHQKASHHAKFHQNQTSSSWVMSFVVQKTSDVKDKFHYGILGHFCFWWYLSFRNWECTLMYIQYDGI